MLFEIRNPPSPSCDINQLLIFALLPGYFLNPLLGYVVADKVYRRIQAIIIAKGGCPGHCRVK
jgi:hypothetical protein